MSKKLLFIPILLFLTLEISALEAEFSFSKKEKTRNLKIVFSSDNVKYSLDFKQNQEGYFSLAMPPFFQIKNKYFAIGEFRLSQGRIVYSQELSYSPKYCGISFTYKNLEAGVTSPVFSPTSPSGAFLSLGPETSFISFSYTNPNSKQTTVSMPSYQTDWSQITASGPSLEIIAHINNQFSGVDSSIQMSKLKGVQKRNTFYIQAFGFYLSKDLENSRTNTLIYEKETENDILKIKYISSEGSKPIYGGTAQQAVFSFSFSYEHCGLGLGFETTKEFKYNTGYEVQTAYSVFYKKGKIKSDVTFVYLRTPLSPPAFTLENLKIRVGKTEFRFQKGKTFLSIVKEIKINGTAVTVTVNQKRELTLETRIEF